MTSRGYDESRSAPENVALALYEVAAALRSLGNQGPQPGAIVEAAFIIKDGLKDAAPDFEAIQEGLGGVGDEIRDLGQRRTPGQIR